MSKNILLILLLLNLLNAKGQDYSNYYHQCNASDSLAHFGFYQQALDSLELAFSSVEWVHSNKYRSAYHIAIKLDQHDKALEYGQKAVLHSGNKSLIKTKSRDFKRSDQYKNLKRSIKSTLAQFDARINHEYIKVLDSLRYVDQRIIRKNKFVWGNYKIDKDKLPENLFDLDSSIWASFDSLVQVYGFPSEEKIGYKAYYRTLEILIHNLRLPENVKYHEQYFGYVKKGYYLPTNTLLWFEQYNQNVLKQTFFTTWDKNTTPENLARLDRNRRAYYLKSTNSINITREGRYMIGIW